MQKSAIVLNKTKKEKFRLGSILALAVSLLALTAPPVAQATTTIFGSFPRITATLDLGKITIIPPTTNSPGEWSFTSSNSKVATVAGSTLTLFSAGSSTITATQAASGVYTQRSRSTLLIVGPGTPTLGEFADQTISITRQSFTLTPPTSTSNGSWTYISANPLIASITDNVVKFLDGGKVEIIATQSNTLNWKSASTRMTLTIVAIPAVIGTFGDITLNKDSVGSITLIPPTSNSPGTWSFTSSNPQVATIYGRTLTPIAIGTSIITAIQAHSGNYGSAKISMILTVQAALPPLGAFADVTAPFSSTSLNTLILHPPTSKSLGAWTFESSDPLVATVNNSMATLLKPGTTTITAKQSAMGTYGPSSPVSMTLTVVGTPTVDVWSNIEKVVKDPDFSLLPPTSNSPGAWTFTSADPDVAEIVGDVVKVKGAGQTVITATQAATPIWTQTTAQMTIRVFGNIPTIGAFASIEAGVGDTPIVIKAPTSNSTGAWTYTSSNKKVATISGTSLVIVGVGVATITATQKPAGNYSQSNTVQTTVTVKPKPIVGDFSNLKIVFGTVAPVIVNPTSTSTAPWGFKSSNPAVVTFSDSIVQMRGVGTATITATQAGTAEFAPIVKTFTIQVLAVPVVKVPVVKNPVVKSAIKVAVAKRVITVAAKSAKAKVTINGAKAKVGKNTVKQGKQTVLVKISDKVVYKKTFTIR
ncbi:MAG: hypothetical protein AABY37_02405 [Actinomycetota bacterium]